MNTGPLKRNGGGIRLKEEIPTVGCPFSHVNGIS